VTNDSNLIDKPQSVREGEELDNARLLAYLREHAPSDSSRSALIHNDYKYDNVVLASEDLSKIIAVLDWEMATGTVLLRTDGSQIWVGW
jgi:aminoglycoside phosphotransferase (APT) family kinase protein